jgi:hypothetical protein
VDADDEPSGWEDGVTGVINCHTPAHHPLDYGAVYVDEGTGSKIFTLPGGTYTDLIILVDGYPDTVRLDAIGWNGGVYFGSTAGTAVARGYGDAGDVIGIADGYCFTLGPEFGWFMCRMDSFSFSGQVTIFIDPALAPRLEVPTSEYPTIQSAMDAAPPGARILVAPGEYRESLNFHGKALTVESQEGPDCTAIVGAGDGLPAVAFTGGEGRDAVLRGFTVRGGAVGVEVRASEPTVAGNVIVSGLACAEPGTRSRLEWQNRIGDPQPAGLGGGPGPSGAAAQGSGSSPAEILLWAGGLGLLAGLLLLAVLSRRRRSEEKSRA